MATPIRLLLVEDSPDDEVLLLRELRRGGYDPVSERVDTAEAMAEALRRGPWDVIVADFRLPSFSAPAALEVLRGSGLDVPFIAVSGSVAEETAVETLKKGAQDFVTKGRLARLVPAITRELQDAASRRARRAAEAGLARRDAILRAVVASAEELLRCSDWTEVVHDVLARLGGALEVNRVSLFENRAEPAGVRTSLRHEWTAPCVPARAAGASVQSVRWNDDGVNRWLDAFRSGDAVQGRIDSLPPEDRMLLGGGGQGCVASVPVFEGETWWGLLAFQDAARDREWSTAELEALRSAGATLGAAIQRSRVEAQVQRQVHRLAGLRAINLAITASLDLGVTLNVLLDHVTTHLGVDAADVLLCRPHTRTLEAAAVRGFRVPGMHARTIRLGEGLAGRAALERRSISVRDLSDPSAGLVRRSLLAEDFVAYYGIPLVAKGRCKGVLEVFHRSPLETDPEWVEFAETLAGHAAVAIDNALLFEDLQTSNLELMLAYDTTLEGWSRALDLRDRETEGHTQRVTELTTHLAAAAGIGEPEMVHVRRGALLHDIGKMAIPDSILLKPGPLDEDEWCVMRLHPVHAHNLLSPIPFLKPALDIPYCHHERWDGKGYPRGLRGNEIPLAARVFSVVDVWDALSSDRPYRRAWAPERTTEHLRSLSGEHFDPAILDCFLERVLPVLLGPRGATNGRRHAGATALHT